MTITYAPPSPPLLDGELATGVHGIRAALQRGRMGSCCMCRGTSLTWWSLTPPSAFVPLHEHCVPRLIELWRGRMAEGDTEPEKYHVQPSGRVGAYARRTATVESAETAMPVRFAGGAMLPESFTPGPYWQPGDDVNTPWTVLLETAAGQTICPAADNRKHAEAVHRRYRQRPELHFGPVIVGAAIISPGGDVLEPWGSVPTPGAPRWEPIRPLSEWRRCPECGDFRWPGSWATLGGICPACQSATETDDPRPWPAGSDHPGSAAVPESMGSKKVTLPASARLKPSLSRGRFTSRRR